MVSGNYPHKYDTKFCPVCKDEKSFDIKGHILKCQKLIDKNQVVMTPSTYNDLFGDEAKTIVEVASVLKENF